MGDFDSWFRVASDRCYVRGVDCDWFFVMVISGCWWWAFESGSYGGWWFWFGEFWGWVDDCDVIMAFGFGCSWGRVQWWFGVLDWWWFGCPGFWFFGVLWRFVVYYCWVVVRELRSWGGEVISSGCCGDWWFIRVWFWLLVGWTLVLFLVIREILGMLKVDCCFWGLVIVDGDVDCCL